MPLTGYKALTTWSNRPMEMENREAPTESQAAWILTYLRKYTHLTPMEALRGHGILRLAARINDLRRCGHPIRTELIVERGKRFARYWMD